MTEPMQLLNVYEVVTDDGPASLICFLDPVLAGARGIDPRAVVGIYGEAGVEDFDAAGFRVNPTFVEALTGYMNEEAVESPEVVAEAKNLASGWLYIVDPRDRAEPDAEPPASNLLGAYAVDEAGQVVPGSFQYNEKHAVFDPSQGPSGVLFDKKFYNWLHGVE